MLFQSMLGSKNTTLIRDFRVATYNIYIGGRDATGRAAIMKHIDRMEADIQMLTENNDTEMRPLLQASGYQYFYGGYLQIASKIPFQYTHTLITNTEWQGLRNPNYVEVEIKGNLIGIMPIHLNSICTGLCHDFDYLNVPPNEPAAYNRNIELRWCMKYFNDRKIVQPLLKGFILLGDYNLISDEANVLEYASVPSGGHALPAHLSLPLANRQTPEKEFEDYNGIIGIDYTNAIDGKTYTWWDDDVSPNPSVNFAKRLDYISYTDALQLIGGEILNSISDSSMVGGLEKFESQLNASDGYVASDHLPVFADFKIN